MIAYHLRQAFKPGEVTPEEANQIGRELALKLTKGNHAFVVCTHVDKYHVHNHIIINSTTLDCQKKFRNFWGSTWAIRRMNDKLCLEHGLSIVENPKPSREHYGTWLGNKKQPSFQEQIRIAIDAALEEKPKDFEELLKKLEAAGIEVNRERKHLRFRVPGQENYTRCDTLKGDYTEQAIKERIAGTRAVKPHHAFSKKTVSKVGLLVDIEAAIRSGKGPGYERWAKVFNLKQLSQAVLAAPILAPNDPNATNLALKNAPPSAEYPLGCDQMGRCELSRLIYGARYSLGLSIPVLIVIAAITLFVGCYSSYKGGILDEIMRLVCDILMAFPLIVIAMSLVSAVDDSVASIIIAIGISMASWFLRMVRSYAKTECGKEYIEASKISGASNFRIVTRHLIPNVLPQFIVYFTTGIATAIMSVSSFAFLGVGLIAGTPEWGAMLDEARSSIYINPSLIIYPGICLIVCCAGFNLLGEGLRDRIGKEDEISATWSNNIPDRSLNVYFPPIIMKEKVSYC